MIGPLLKQLLRFGVQHLLDPYSFGVVVKMILNTEPKNKIGRIIGLKAKNPPILPIRVLNSDT